MQESCGAATTCHGQQHACVCQPGKHAQQHGATERVISRARAQVYELERFKVVHVSRYAAPVLSLGLAPNCALLAVGLADGQLLVRRHSHNRGAAPGLPGANP